jgi:CDP-diacylglycerol---serine O-phosphatidyltransferase
MKIIRAILPSLFTMGNLFMGFYSVICSTSGKISWACWLIIGAGFLDAADGKVARLIKSSSRFGVEYDSLADVVSFGLAPSVLVYVLLAEYLGLGITVLLLSFLPLLCGSIRLARFNIQLTGFSKEYFVGLPIPLAAATLAGFVMFMQYVYGVPLPPPYLKVMIVLIVIVSVLMISTIRYEIMPNLTFSGSTRQVVSTLLLLALLVLIILFPLQVIFPLTVLYLLSGLLRWVLYPSTRSTKGES